MYVQFSIEQDKGCFAAPPLVFFMVAAIWTGMECGDSMIPVPERGKGES